MLFPHSPQAEQTRRTPRAAPLLLLLLSPALALSPVRPSPVQPGWFQTPPGVYGPVTSPYGQRVTAPTGAPVPAAPSTPSLTTPTSATALEGDWVLVSAGELRAVGGRNGVLHVWGGMISGTDGCTSFGAPFRVAARVRGTGTLALTGAVTRARRACLPEEDQLSLAGALTQGVAYALGVQDGRMTLTLTLTSGDNAGYIWVYTRDLSGGRW